MSDDKGIISDGFGHYTCNGLACDIAGNPLPDADEMYMANTLNDYNGVWHRALSKKDAEIARLRAIIDVADDIIDLLTDGWEQDSYIHARERWIAAKQEEKGK